MYRLKNNRIKTHKGIIFNIQVNIFIGSRLKVTSSVIFFYDFIWNLKSVTIFTRRILTKKFDTIIRL